MTDLARILPHVVSDSETGQFVAAFATEDTANRFVRDMHELTDREYKVSATRRRSD